MSKEIYWNIQRDMMMLEDLDTKRVTRFDEMPQSFFVAQDAAVKVRHPEQHTELCQLVGRVGSEYGRFFQFAACNFSTKDGQPDIDDDGNFLFERVSCPVRHTCKRITCHVHHLGMLSHREREVVELFARGMDEESIATALFISKFTVHNHVNTIYKKLNFTGAPHPDRLLIAFAIKNKIV